MKNQPLQETNNEWLFAQCSYSFIRMFFMRAVNLFHHHNGIINDQTNGGSNSAKCHDIQSVTNRIQYNQCKAQV